VEGPQAAAAAPPPGGVCAADIFACWDLVRHPTSAVARSFHPQFCSHVPTDCAADINNCSRMSFLALESNSWQVRLLHAFFLLWCHSPFQALRAFTVPRHQLVSSDIFFQPLGSPDYAHLVPRRPSTSLEVIGCLSLIPSGLVKVSFLQGLDSSHLYRHPTNLNLAALLHWFAHITITIPPITIFIN
jgi:hypothetical protein